MYRKLRIKAFSACMARNRILIAVSVDFICVLWDNVNGKGCFRKYVSPRNHTGGRDSATLTEGDG